MTVRRIILGADAGGTKTLAWLAAALPDGQFDVLGRGASGPGNPLRSGREAAWQNVAAAMAAAGADAGVSLADTAQIVVGMAGAGRPEMQHEASCWLQQHIGVRQIQVIPDFELVLAAAFPNREGIAVISGTGSVVHGIRGTQQTRVGGWGYLVGDHGSGYWFGRAALQAMVRAADGRRANSTISNLIHEKFDKTSAAEIIASLHDSPEHVAEIAALAPLVFDAALAGDEVADQIIADAAHGLAEMIVAAARKLAYADSEVSLAAAGGVFAGAAVFGERLLAALKEQAYYPRNFDIVREPVRGALRLAT